MVLDLGPKIHYYLSMVIATDIAVKSFEQVNSIYAHASLYVDTRGSYDKARLRDMLEGWYRGSMEHLTEMPEPRVIGSKLAFEVGKRGEIPFEILDGARYMRNRVRSL